MTNAHKMRVAFTVATFAAAASIISVFLAARRRKHHKSPSSSCYLHSEQKPKSAFKRVLADNSYTPFKHLSNDANASNLHPYEAEIMALLKNPQPEIEFGTAILDLEMKDACVWVHSEMQLKELVDVLSKQRFFAVDTEQHSLRSFLGFTALVQISTPEKDYLVDTIALHDFMGILCPVFANPSICKVFHGADNDVVWLQRDFHIYVVNLFDTSKACEVLSKPQKSLAYLLETYCGVTTNKLLQLEDWRQRPLSTEMVHYARTDAHYLLYIANCLINELKLLDNENSCSDDKFHFVLEASRRSNMICLQLFTKEIEAYPGESSALSLFSRQMSSHDISNETQNIVRQLCAWRDLMARIHDESLKYVLSDQAIVALASQSSASHSEIYNTIAQAPEKNWEETTSSEVEAKAACYISMADPNPNLNPNSNLSYGHVTYFKPFTSQVTFRLLCHASRVGAIIGKSGVLIKTLQESTGAKIRIEDAPSDSSDRVILVSAAGGNGELSTAQEALLKVFDRVLDVAAETAGDEVGDRVVSCRLLADTAQVGAVIGKAGKVVEKIRIDTGCKIRVLNEGLPACTAPSDEIVEIEGQLTSLKKALIAVCHRLQDCPPPDRTKIMGSRHYEVVQSETFSVPLESLTNLHIDHRLQRSSTLSTSSNRSNGNVSRAHKLSAEVNRVSVLDPKALQQEVTFRIICSNDRVGAVIGKGGCIVRGLQNESGAIISVGPSLVECEDRLITITASENPESRYSPAQKAVVLVFSKSVETGVEKGLDLGSKKESYVTARLVVPSNQVGCLLGKGGTIVSEMRKTTGTNIRIIGNDLVPKCVSDNDQLVQIWGEFSNVQAAIYKATGRLRDHLFASTQNCGGARSLSTVVAGGQPTVSVSHSFNRHSSPGLQAPQTVAGINSRGTNGVSWGLTSQKGGLELVSGSKTAIVTNTAVQIVVPDRVIGSVYGENGSNLARLRQISGAKVMVHEPCPGTSDRTIVISGTPDETRAAQSLLQAFILTGSS